MRFFSISDSSHFLNGLQKHAGSSDKIDTVAHYFSDTAVLDAILSTGVLRASNIYFLNDWQEHKNGLDFLATKVFTKYQQIAKVLTELRIEGVRKNAGIYSISFATDADNLQHWITYAKHTGVCVELDSECLQSHVCYWQKMADKAFDPQDQSPLAHIAYENTEATENTLKNPEKVKEFFLESSKILLPDSSLTLDRVNAIINTEMRLHAYLNFLATYYKVGKFTGEKELRMSFFPREDSFENKSRISYHRMESGVLRPYIEIMIGKKVDPDPAIPISRITVSPGDTQGRCFESLIHRIEYGDTKGIWRDDTGDFVKKQKDLFEQAKANSASKSDFDSKNYFSCSKGIWIRKSETPYIF